MVDMLHGAESGMAMRRCQRSGTDAANNLVARKRPQYSTQAATTLLLEAVSATEEGLYGGGPSAGFAAFPRLVICKLLSDLFLVADLGGHHAHRCEELFGQRC
jgi:hypothetical protein